MAAPPVQAQAAPPSAAPATSPLKERLVALLSSITEEPQRNHEVQKLGAGSQIAIRHYSPTTAPAGLQINQSIVGVLGSYPERTTATTEFAEAFEQVVFDPKHLTGGAQNGPQPIVSCV